MERGGWRCRREAWRRRFRRVFVRVVIESGNGEVDDVGESAKGRVAQGLGEGEGLGGWVAAEMVIVVVGGTEVEEEDEERAMGV